MDQSVVPIIDMLELRKASRKELNRLFEALSGIGFVYIKNHGVAEREVSAIMQSSKIFFSQSLESKEAIKMSKARQSWRGYFSVGKELTLGKPDWKEGIYFGREHDEHHPGVINSWPLHGKNLWPANPKLQDFRNQILDYMKKLEGISGEFLGYIALCLGLDLEYFVKRFAEPTVLFRIFNYPALVGKETKDLWSVAEHTDMGFLTVLKQDQSGGLEAKTLDGVWVEVAPVEDTFVINIGVMLELWTGGLLRATPPQS